MPPKKGKNKKSADNWDEGLGDAVESTVAPVTTVDNADVESTPPVAASNPAVPADEEEVGGGSGGLMAMLKKRGKKGKKGKAGAYPDWEDESANQNDTPEPAAVEPTATPAAPAPSPPPAPAAVPEADNDDEPAEGGRLLTKKEKERLRKEKEKQRKKEQAAKKKGDAPVGNAPAAAAPVVQETVAKAVAAPEPEPVAPAGKGKKMNATLRAIQKQQELRRQQEAEFARLEAEEIAKLEELTRKEEEERKHKEELRAAKKQKEKEKVEQLKREGKYMTKVQKEAARKAEIRKAQMLEMGSTIVAGLQEGADTVKKPKYDKGKKKRKTAAQQAEEIKSLTEKVAEVKVEEKVASKPVPEPETKGNGADVSDWEELLDDTPNPDAKESWDMSSDEEDAKPAPAKDSKTTAKPSQKKSKDAESDDDDEDEDDSEDDSDDDSEDGSDDSEDSDSEADAKPSQKRTAADRANALRKRAEKHEAAVAAGSVDDLRSPICCILGHVDTGKTKLLDKIRQTNVQEGEAGGITQQIGATYFPVKALKQKVAVVNKDDEFEFKVPGLLVIDTPGHESFTNLRSRGSSLCNIAILVIDIMHGLEPQTIESIQLLRDRKTPFIVALNKIDRLYSWKSVPNNGFCDSLAKQSPAVQAEFQNRLEKTKLALAEQGLNSELFYNNKSLAKNVSLVPTSAHTGEGIPDLLKLLVGLAQERMTGSLMYLSEVEATILEVKVIEGLGTTIDIILSNGILKEGDKIILCGLNGPIKTHIRALLTPAEMKELRVKSQYVHNKEIKAAMGIKIAADGLDSAIAGSRLLVVGEDDDEDDLEDEVMSDLEGLLTRISTTGVGVSVQASTLGSLEALLEFLRVSKIPVANISIGPVFKRDVMQCGAMLERSPEHAVMLCFDVRVDKEAETYAKEAGVKIFTADIIYHLFDAFTAHLKQVEEQKKEESKLLAVFPCVLRPVAVFNKKDPIVIGVDVVEGALRMHTPICAIKTDPVTGKKEFVKLGRVTSIERDHKALQIVKRGEPSVAIKIEGNNQPMYGRHLEEKDILYSMISRKSIDVLKQYFKTDMSMEEWKLILKLKPHFDIS